MASKDLEYLFHHVFLPPKVPHFEDTKDGAGDRALVDRLAHLTISFRDLCPIQHYQQWSTLGRAIRTFKLLHTGKTSYRLPQACFSQRQRWWHYDCTQSNAELWTHHLENTSRLHHRDFRGIAARGGGSCVVEEPAMG